MFLSLALILLVGLLAGTLFERLKLPRIIGMLLTGIVIGPYALNWLDPSVLSISADLRKMALIIILLKAGLSFDLSDLKKSGSSAIWLAFLPATFEMIAYTIVAPIIFDISYIDAAVLGAVIAAVSPAVVVPRMVNLIEGKYGTAKGIPQMILAGASMDDIYTIVLFTTFLNTALSGSIAIRSFLTIPVAIVLGVLLGVIAGYGIYFLFEMRYNQGRYVRNTMKIIIIVAVALLLVALEDLLEPFVPTSGLLSVMSMASMLRVKSEPIVSQRLSEKLGKIWLSAEVFLFVLVGAAVDITYTLNYGREAVLIIFICLLVRSIGVILSIARRDFTKEERLFCVIAYLPKATVQAAIGSIPLISGLESGNLILSIAVLTILITAPLGAIGIDKTYANYLEKEMPT